MTEALTNGVRQRSTAETRQVIELNTTASRCRLSLAQRATSSLVAPTNSSQKSGA
jgi:hypothetical protein